MLNVNPVAQTGESGTTPQGNLAGFGTAHMSGKGFTYTCLEYGYMMFLVTTRADLTYQEGLEKMWGKSSRFEIMTPELESIGEQEIYNWELYYTDEANDLDGTNNGAVFGYTPRYEEYRYQKSQITGRFRSNATSTFDPWILSEEFGSLPTLSSSFLEENAPMSRIKATAGDPDYIFDSYFDCYVARKMKKFGIPGGLNF